MFILHIEGVDSPTDQEFIEALYQDFHRLMFSTAQQYTSNVINQEDIVQSAIERLVKKISTIRPMKRGTLASYVTYTVRHTAIDYMRKQGHVSEHNVSLSTFDIDTYAGASPSLDEKAILAEQIGQLQDIWPKLPEEDQILLEGKYIWGHTDEELAAFLKCKPSSIRMKLTRARRRALILLSEQEEV